ncbi:MAG: DoxX family membrane protein, partial [Acidobacteriota bacterium]|nr:DoxX family membrane protein [Acidobacteriota bacterium]
MPASRPVRHVRAPERRLPLGAPVRAWAQAEWALLPLRCFLGLTFLYAGLQKLANPNFLNSQSANSIQAQLIAATRVSPIKFLLTHLVQFAKPIGIIIALAEIAVGVGSLLGLWTRVAALGGAILSLSLFLTVSFHASPYFTGADIVFFFAWLPFIVAGSGSRLSIDSWIAVRAAKTERAPSPTLVPIPFAQV